MIPGIEFTCTHALRTAADLLEFQSTAQPHGPCSPIRSLPHRPHSLASSGDFASFLRIGLLPLQWAGNVLDVEIAFSLHFLFYFKTTVSAHETVDREGWLTPMSSRRRRALISQLFPSNQTRTTISRAAPKTQAVPTLGHDSGLWGNRSRRFTDK
jgi:hypothetical protein